MESIKNEKTEIGESELDKSIIFNESAIVILHECLNFTEFTDDQILDIENSMKSTTVQLKDRTKTIKAMDLERIKLPELVCNIVVKFTEGDINLSALTLINSLSYKIEIPFNVMYDTNAIQYFLDFLKNAKFDNSNDFLTRKSLMLSTISNNCIFKTDTIQEYLSIGLFDSLTSVFEDLLQLSSDDASENYLKMCCNELFKLFSLITNYPVYSDKITEFILGNYAVENDYISEQLLELTCNFVKSRCEISQLFHNNDFIHYLYTKIFDSNDAASALAEYVLYGEKDKDLIPIIHDFCLHFEFSEIINKILEDFDDSQKLFQLLRLCANVIFVLPEIPNEWTVEKIYDVVECSKEKNFRVQKVSVFLLVSFWMKYEPFIFAAVATPELLSFVFDVSQNSPEILKYVLECFGRILSAYSSISSVNALPDEIHEFLVDIADNAAEQDSDVAQKLLNDFYPNE